MYCNKCGKEMSEESKFCNTCGQKVQQETSNPITQKTTPTPAKGGSITPYIGAIIGAIVGWWLASIMYGEYFWSIVICAFLGWVIQVTIVGANAEAWLVKRGYKSKSASMQATNLRMSASREIWNDPAKANELMGQAEQIELLDKIANKK